MTDTKHISDAINGLPDDEFLRTPHPANRQHIYSNHLKALVAENEALKEIAERLKGEAEIHAQEARTANSTINEIDQVCSNAAGEKGNWNGAQPVREMKADLEAKLATETERREILEVCAAALYLGHDDAKQQFDMYRKVYIEPTQALATISGDTKGDDDGDAMADKRNLSGTARRDGIRRGSPSCFNGGSDSVDRNRRQTALHGANEMNKAERDAERINWLVKTFGEVSVGTQIEFLRWMDDREAVLVAALELYANPDNWNYSDEERDYSGFRITDSMGKANTFAANALKEYRGEQ